MYNSLIEQSLTTTQPIRPRIRPNPKKSTVQWRLIPIKIFHPNGQFVTLHIDPSIKIHDLKTQIEYIMDISITQQRLLFQGEPLMDDKTFKDYNFPTAIFLSIITEQIQIFIKTLSGKTISMNMDKTDKIASIKEHILYKEGIAIHHQTLIFGGKHIEDGNRLCDYEITSGSVLYLALQFRCIKTTETDNIQILIKSMMNKPIATLNIKRNNTIESMKRMIEVETSVLCEQQQVIFAEQYLDDNECISDYNIYNNSVLYLLDPFDDIDDDHYIEYTPSISSLSSCSLSKIPEIKETFEICVEIPEIGQIIEVEVEWNQTVQNIKSKIEMKEIMPKEDQILIYSGQQLDDGKTLLDYNIDCIDAKVALRLKLKGFTKFLIDKLMYIYCL